MSAPGELRGRPPDPALALFRVAAGAAAAVALVVLAGLGWPAERVERCLDVDAGVEVTIEEGEQPC